MSKKEKKPLIKYTSRDFSSIKSDLIQFAKRYYPDSYKDFNEASFGSFMLDSVAYFGDILSFYVDYQANESFIQTAVEYKNVRKLAEQMGFKFQGSASSVGISAFFVLVPSSAAASFGPDKSYIPVLKAGSTFVSTSGASFTLIDDVRFDTADTEQVAAKFNDTTGQPTFYALKNYGKVISGKFNTEFIPAGPFEKFKKLKLRGKNIVEILEVLDSEGKEYFEVEYLSHNVVYKEIENRSSDKAQVPSILRPYVVPRRFVTTSEKGSTHLQFGFGGETELITAGFAQPDSLFIQRYGKTYETEQNFDPSKLLNSDKLGISPADTVLTIKYRYNDSNSVNIAVGALTGVTTAKFSYEGESLLDSSKVREVNNSLEIYNEDSIVGQITLPSTDEIRNRAYNHFATQNRAVTQNDLQSISYGMPTKFGAIKRAAAYKDTNSFKRNINLYVLSEDRSRKLVVGTDTLKDNLKNWLNRYKMMHDTIDILDGKIVNFGIEFTCVYDKRYDPQLVLAEAKSKLAEHFQNPGDFGQSVSLSEIYSVLNKMVKGIIDTKKVKIIPKNGTNYSSSSYDFDAALSADGTMVVVPRNVCMEVKYKDLDIKGVIE
jgi:hypothetical protein